MKIVAVVIKTALCGMALAASYASASDQDLLDTLFENGVLNKAQYEKLTKQATEKAMIASPVINNNKQEDDWTSRVKMSGDIRFRQEFRDSDITGSEKSRSRIRARLAVKAEVNDEVDVGFRLVTAGGTTSTNQTLEGGFGGKNIFFDRAFVKWNPQFADGGSLIAGKMKQPWFSVSNVIWDTDVNPEGLALTYKKKLGSFKLGATGGYFLLTNNDNGSFSDDMTMYHAGINGAMKFNDMAKATLGFNTYLYNGTTLGSYLNCETGKTCPDGVTGFAGDNVNGDADADFKLYEVAGKIDLDTELLPIQLFGNYVINAANGIKSSEDSAWLAGITTKYDKFKLSYNYRDTQLNAVPDTFNDSDFNAGATSARGHVVKLGYNISKNFSASFAYLAAKEYTDNNEGKDGTNRETLQVDVKAKF
ncbi:MAG: putative porin [Methylococcales bacterium]|nr:putative porin [Methylococcales bacterium]